MSIQEEIEKGIGAHGLWKQRLVDAIETGESDWAPEDVCRDDKCAFGQWLYSCSPTDKSSPFYEDVRTLHAKFHKKACGILKMALEGHKQEAESEMVIGSEYRKISSTLTLKLIEWKDT